MARLLYILLATTSMALTATAVNTMCYFPDGTASPTDFVCNSTTADGFSSCCGNQQDGSQAYCMSNGLCISDMFLSRGSCTDKSWNSPNCASVCTKTNPGGGIGVRACGYTGKWDCGDGSDCAQNAINIPTGNFELSNAQLASMGLSKAAASSSVPSPSTGVLSAEGETATVTLAASASASSDVSPGIVGAAVGAPLAVLAISFLTMWLLERRKTNQVKQQLAHLNNEKNFSHPGYSPEGHSSHHGSLSQSGTINNFAAVATGNRDGPSIHRDASQYSVISPTSQSHHARGPSAWDMKPMQALHMQHGQNASVQRMPSTTSQFGVHPAYHQQQDQHDNYSGPMKGGPPPPPKAYGPQSNAWAAEVAGEESLNSRRGMTQVQELPVERN